MTKIKGVARHVHWLVAAFALALMCVPRHESAADDRSDLIRRIEDKLKDAADALERLPDDNGDGAIDRARSLVAEARRYADDLARVADDDRDAKRLAEDFDDRQEDFDDAAANLRSLKGGQRVHESVATMCVERDKELTRVARDFEARNDPDGLAELPREASKAQDATKRALDDLARQDDKMEDWSDDAQDFSADGPWRKLASIVDQVARATYDRWHRGHEAAVKTCAAVTLGVDHPEVKDALAKLGSSAGGRKAIIEQLDKDARELASVLSRVSEDSGMGSIERAKTLLADIERGVDSLGRTATTDKAVKVIVEKWPEGVKQLTSALEALERLKQHQHDMDPLPDRCKQREQDLADAIRKYDDKPDGAAEIAEIAEQLAAPVRAGLDKARERLREQDRDRDKARDVSASEGPWSDIRSAAQRDADETFKTYEDGLKKTESACEHVVKGKDAPQVRAALGDLQAKTTNRDELIKAAEAQIDASAQLLTNVASKTDDREIAAAIALASELEQTLSRLKSAPGPDPRTKDILDKWPGYLTRYQVALGHLVSLKRAQFELDGMVAKCESDEAALAEFLAQYKDPAGIAPIEARAATTKAALEAATATHRTREPQLSDWHRAAHELTITDGKWSYLSGYVRTGAQDSLAHWKAALAAGQKACANLALGVEHPKIEKLLTLYKKRIPPKASHSDDHDSTCKGMPAGGFCMADDQCLDGECSNNKCDRCPSRADGRCHPPGTCDQRDYSTRQSEMKVECGRTRKGTTAMSCATLEEVCNNAQACVARRLHVHECHRGGDTRHMVELNKARGTAKVCEEILQDKRDRGKCD